VKDQEHDVLVVCADCESVLARMRDEREARHQLMVLDECPNCGGRHLGLCPSDCLTTFFKNPALQPLCKFCIYGETCDRHR